MTNMLLLALAIATQASFSPGQMIRTCAHDLNGNVVFDRDMRRQTQIMMLKRDIERALGKQIVVLTKLGRTRQLRDDEVLRDLVTAAEPNLLDLHIGFHTPGPLLPQLCAARTMMATGATVSGKPPLKRAASSPAILSALTAETSSSSNESEEASAALPEQSTRFDEPRKWGESRPGEVYVQWEGPGNPSWERRMQRGFAGLNLERATPEQSTTPDESEEASPRSPSRDDTCSRPSRMYPAHWGCPPGLQTMDIRLLPGGYGYGSSTLAGWIARNMARDKELRRNIEDASTTPDEERRGGAFVDKPFPAHWGNPPRWGTMDFRVLPGGYGHGSSTLANWISMNMRRDAGTSADGGRSRPPFPITY